MPITEPPSHVTDAPLEALRVWLEPAARPAQLLATVDHKTLAAVRPQAGEIPTETGEIPTTDEAAGDGP